MIVEPPAVRADSRATCKAIFARDAAALLAGHRRVVPDQGGDRRAGRARSRAAPHAQLRPHRRPRARGGDEVPPLPPRRGGRYGMLVAAELAVARGALAGSRSRRRSRRSSRSWARCRRSPTCRPAEVVEATRRDKKMVAGRLHFVLPTAIGATTTVDDVTPKELRGGADRRVGLQGLSATTRSDIPSASRAAPCS